MEQIRQKVVDELFALTMLEVGYNTRIDLQFQLLSVLLYNNWDCMLCVDLVRRTGKDGQ